VGTPRWASVRVPRREANKRAFIGNRPGEMIHLRLTTPVAGPLRLGHSSSSGWELFRPIEEPDHAWARLRKTLFAEKLLPPLSNRVHVADRVQKDFAGLELARKVEVNQAIVGLSAHAEHGRTLPKSRTFKKVQGAPLPGSTHELDRWSSGDTRQLFGHFDASSVLTHDHLAGHLP
jgi:hypothetical protein